MPVSIRFSKFVHFFLISAVLGSGVGYGPIYLFHLAVVMLLLGLFSLAFSGRNTCLVKPRSYFFYFLIFMFYWYLIGIIWSIEPIYTLRYLVYITLGISVVFVVTAWSTNEDRYQSVFNIIKWIFLFEIFISLLEIFTPFRWPISPYSEYAHIFNRQGTDFDLFSDEVVYLIKLAPTGFAGNPNNLALTLVTILPFFLFSKQWIVKLLGLTAILIITVFTGSRGAFIALLFGMMVYLFIKNKLVFIAIIISLALLISNLMVAIELLKNSENKRISEIAYSGDILYAYLMDFDNSKGSISVRQELITNGLKALKKTDGLGVGGGGSQAVQERLGGVKGKITSMHNFWIEILVDSGVLFFSFFVIWYILISLKLYLMYMSAKSAFYRYHSGALFVSFSIFSI